MHNNSLAENKRGNVFFVGLMALTLSLTGWLVLGLEGMLYCSDSGSEILAADLANRLHTPVDVISISEHNIRERTIQPNSYHAGCKGDAGINDYALVSLRNIGDHISHMFPGHNR